MSPKIRTGWKVKRVIEIIPPKTRSRTVCTMKRGDCKMFRSCRGTLPKSELCGVAERGCALRGLEGWTVGSEVLVEGGTGGVELVVMG